MSTAEHSRVEHPAGLTAVIVHWGAVAPTVRLANDLSRQRLIDGVVVVANDRQARPDDVDVSVCWCVPPRNLGFAGGFEFGAGSGPSAEFYLLLNNDVEIDDPCIAACLRVFTDRNVGVVAPLLFNSGGLQSGVGRIKHPFFTASVDTLPRSDRPDYDADWVTGAVMFIRRRCHDTVRFNVSYFLGWEDADFCFRARRDGWRVTIASDAKANHRGGMTTIPLFAPSYHYMRNRVWFARRWGSGAEASAVWLFIALCLTPRILISDSAKRQDFRHTRSVLHALVDSLRHLPPDDVVPVAEPRPANWGTWQ